MRDIVVVIAILVLIVSASVWAHRFYEDTKNDIDKKLVELAETINIEINKEEKISQIEEFWKEKENILIIFQEHDSIDEIENHLYECLHYYSINKKDEFDIKKTLLINELDDLIKRECVSIVNIF